MNMNDEAFFEEQVENPEQYFPSFEMSMAAIRETLRRYYGRDGMYQYMETSLLRRLWGWEDDDVSNDLIPIFRNAFYPFAALKATLRACGFGATEAGAVVAEARKLAKSGVEKHIACVQE